MLSTPQAPHIIGHPSTAPIHLAHLQQLTPTSTQHPHPSSGASLPAMQGQHEPVPSELHGFPYNYILIAQLAHQIYLVTGNQQDLTVLQHYVVYLYARQIHALVNSTEASGGFPYLAAALPSPPAPIVYTLQQEDVRTVPTTAPIINAKRKSTDHEDHDEEGIPTHPINTNDNTNKSSSSSRSSTKSPTKRPTKRSRTSPASSSSPSAAAPNNKKKRRARQPPAPAHAPDPNKKCQHCDRTADNTRQWRSGPDGRSTLCNACGMKYRRWKEKEERMMNESIRNPMSCYSPIGHESDHGRSPSSSLPSTPIPSSPSTFNKMDLCSIVNPN